MAHLEVVYDPAKEMAAIVNVDERQSWGPAMVGPDAGQLLQTWLDAMPFDVAILDVNIATQLFQEWLVEMVNVAAAPAPTPDIRPVEPMGDGGLVEAARAETEAADGRGEPPEPAPADADLEANEGTPATVIVCPLCNGDKYVDVDGDGNRQPCGMCHTLGIVTMAGTP